MLLLSRGLPVGLLVAGLAALAINPADLRAQAKKEAKKDAPAVKKDATVVKKDEKKGPADDMGDKTVAFGTSDGLTLKGHWFQGQALDKQRPDAVMMFPAPGSKVTDAWIELAKEMAKKNFSVLLFDWRGCGMNGPDAGSRVFESTQLFWDEPYNQKLLSGRKRTIEDKGLDYKTLEGRSEGNLRYREFMLNDLLGARFFLDRQNDNQKCNTNRVWVVSEKDGAHMGLAFIATEFTRNSIFTPTVTPAIGVQYKGAGRDYVGLVALSYSNGNNAASAIFRNALPASSVNPGVKEAKSHLEARLAALLLYSKKEGASASKALVSSLGVGTSEEHMKSNYKYLREIDVNDLRVTGIDIIGQADPFKVRDKVVENMVGISKAQPFGKDATDRQANKMLNVPRFQIEAFRGR